MRENRKLVGPFIEESLRTQSPTKVDFRLARKTTTLGGVHIPAGTVVMLCLGAANRDPLKFEDPHEFRLDRKNVREHIAFGRGIHTCAGAPLARVEGVITVNRMLDRMRDITISEAKHGAAEDRQYRYEPTFLLRGFTELHIDFTRSLADKISVGVAQQCDVGDQPDVFGHRRGGRVRILLAHGLGNPSVSLERRPRPVFLRQRFDAGFPYQPGDLVHQLGEQRRVRGGR